MSEIRRDLDNRISGVVGRDAGISGIPTIQVFFLAGIFATFLPFIIFNPALGVVLFGSVVVAWLFLTGGNPTQFFERLPWNKPKKYISSEPSLEFNNAGIPVPEKIKGKTVTLQLKGKKIKAHYIEERYEFLTHLQVDRDYSCGAYILQKNASLMFIFVWEVVAGDDPSATHEQALFRVESAKAAVSQLPYEVDLKGYEDCFKDSTDYIEKMGSLLDDPKLNQLERELIKSRIEKAIAMEGGSVDLGIEPDANIILNRRSIITAKFKVPLGTKTEYKRNVIERSLAKLGPALGIGLKEAPVDRWAETIELAYNSVFKPVNAILESPSGFSLKVRPLNAQEIFERDWSDLHNSKPPLVPHCIVFDSEGLQPPVINDFSHHNTLFFGEMGEPVLPEFGDNVIYIPSKRKYAGFLRIGKPFSNFPEQEGSKALGLYRYIYNRMTQCGRGNAIHDYRIVWEVVREDAATERMSLDRNISTSVKQAAAAHTRNTRDVPAEERQEEAVEARKKLLQNDPPCHLGIGVWLYRDSIDELNYDISALAGNFAGASTERSHFMIQSVWEQTWLFEGSLFLTKPYYKCQKLMASESIPQIPTIKAPSLDRSGTLLLHKELRTAAFLDICGIVPNHTAVLAITGGGKSIFLSDMITEVLIRNNPAVIFDFPRPDGTSTYTDFIRVLSMCGKRTAYYDVRKPINAIEFIDLSKFSEDDYKVRYETTVSDHIDLLLTLVIGSDPLPGEERDYRPAISTMYHDFLSQPSIQKRYEYAAKAGFGNSGYEEMPTIEKDLFPFLQEWTKRKIASASDSFSEQVYATVLRRIEGRLHTDLGRSIKGPSSFNIDVDVLVVALTDVKADDASLIYATTGMNLLTRKAMQHYASTCFVDEGTSLFKLKPFAKKISEYPPMARKYGSNLVLAAQVVDPIFESGFASAIFGNMSNIFLGFCSQGIYQEMISPKIGMRPDIASKYMSEDFKANPQRGESYWYLKRANKHMELTFPVNDLLLTLTSNDVPEVLARERFRIKYANKDNPSDISWILNYSKVYTTARRNRVPLDRICPEVKLSKELLEAIAA